MRGGKRANAGRKEGITAKVTKDMKDAYRSKYPDFNPLIEMHELYLEVDDVKHKTDILKWLGDKFIPDLKAVDVVTNGQSLNKPAIIQLIGNPTED